MNISRKFFMISIVALALGIPLFVIYMLVWDRQATEATNRAEISAGWAREQNLRGPWLVVPFTERRLETVATPPHATDPAVPAKQVVTERQDALVIAPDDLHVAARLDPQIRRRSLFEMVVYQSRLSVDARFGAVDQSNIDPALLDWKHAYFVIAISDPHGFGGAIPHIAVDGRIVEAEPGSRNLEVAGGTINVPAGLTSQPVNPIRLSTRLPIKGSTGFTVDSSARRLNVDITSQWPHPSFTGALLPDTRTISDQGFRAHWSTSHIAGNRPLVERASAMSGPAEGELPIAGVKLIEPVDLYAQVERSLKYGILFIALTFLTFFTYDVTGRRRVPMLAYALVGLGLVLFFLLLLALAEYISFAPAYVLAAAALIGLISAYSKAVLGGPARGAVIGGVLTLLYGVLYVLLQLEDYGLLLGSIVLFAALAVLMYVTRNVGEAELVEPA